MIEKDCHHLMYCITVRYMHCGSSGSKIHKIHSIERWVSILRSYKDGRNESIRMIGMKFI